MKGKIILLIFVILVIGFLPAFFAFAQSAPPANWPDWLKKEREQNIKDVRQVEEWALSVGWKSLQNDNLPQLLEWAKEHEFKFIGTGETIKDEVSITVMPGIDIIFKELNNFPSHLIKLLRGTTVYLSTEYGGSTTWTSTESESKIGISIKKAFIRQTKPPDEMTHELAHALDMVSIRVDKSSEFTIGKTDEEVRLLREEFERVFQIPKEPWTDSTKAPPGFVNIYASTNSSENFATHFDYYINQPEYFRERAAKESGLAEKYEFLKNKIFLGKEYFKEKSVIATPAPVSTPTPTQLNEIQKTESKTTPTAMTTPAQTNVFTKILQRGTSGDEVKKLQEFLKQSPDIYPEGLVTGYFGPLTEAAVKRFQTKFQIVSSGSPVTTGYGLVGPKTRAKLNKFLSAQPLSTPTSPPAETTKPKESIKPDSSPAPTPTPAPVQTPKQISAETKCSDGTLDGQCSITKPNQCSDRILKANCQVCSCGIGFYCQSSGNCAREISLVSPTNWTDELKREWNDNIEEVRKVAEGMQQWNWDWESLHNEDLPKLIQWGTEHSPIKLVYGGAFESERVPRVAIPGVNAVFEAFSAMPLHLIKMLEGGVGGTLYLTNRFENCSNQAGCYLSGAFYITICPSGTGDIHTTAHELGHIVDCVGIRNAKGNEFSFGKTGEEINNLRKEYERIFQPPPLDSAIGLTPLSDYDLKESFAGWFSDYITPGYVQRFRKEATQDPIIAEKYEFLKTKIFLGKEY